MCSFLEAVKQAQLLPGPVERALALKQITDECNEVHGRLLPSHMRTAVHDLAALGWGRGRIANLLGISEARARTLMRS